MTKRLWSLATVAVLWALPAVLRADYATEVLNDNPHFYLRLNEPNGSSVAEDAGPNNIDGAYHQFGSDAPVVTGVPGIPGGGTGNTAAAFYGSPSQWAQVSSVGGLARGVAGRDAGVRCPASGAFVGAFPLRGRTRPWPCRWTRRSTCP
jgi:hypothetical protein